MFRHDSIESIGVNQVRCWIWNKTEVYHSSSLDVERHGTGLIDACHVTFSVTRIAEESIWNDWPTVWSSHINAREKVDFLFTSILIERPSGRRSDQLRLYRHLSGHRERERDRGKLLRLCDDSFMVVRREDILYDTIQLEPSQMSGFGTDQSVWSQLRYTLVAFVFGTISFRAWE